MKFCERPQGDGVTQDFPADGGEGSSVPSSGIYQSQSQSQIPQSARSSAPGRPPTSPPLPGILKARIKHEH